MFSQLIEAGKRIVGRERRCYDRLPAVLPASVTVSGYAYPCTTVNLSEGGAQLRFPSAQAVCGFIEFRVPSIRLKAHARVVWHDGERMGIEFIR